MGGMIFALLLPACTGEGDSALFKQMVEAGQLGVYGLEVRAQYDRAYMEPNETLQMQAWALGELGADVEDISDLVQWSSSDSSIASLSNGGQISAHAVLGDESVTVTATFSGLTSDYVMTVSDAAVETISVASASVDMCQNVQMLAEGDYPDGARVITDLVAWEVTDTDDGFFDAAENGLLHSTSDTSTAVQASHDGQIGTDLVSVNNTLTALSLGGDLSLYAGDTELLSAVGTYGTTDTTIDVANINWVSEATTVATVSAGVVSAVAPGTATITAACSSIEGTVGITVEKTINGISLKTDPVNDGSSNSRLESGDSVVIDAFVTYEASQETEMTTAQYSDVTWTLEPASSDQFEWHDDTRELKSLASTSESKVIIQAAWKDYEKEITVYLGE